MFIKNCLLKFVCPPFSDCSESQSQCKYFYELSNRKEGGSLVCPCALCRFLKLPITTILNEVLKYYCKNCVKPSKLIYYCLYLRITGNELS